MMTPKVPVIVDFPLRGEWYTPNTPAKRIPSHGTDMLGETYAYDFMMIDWDRKGKPFFKGSVVRHFLLGTPLARCYGWGQEVYAPLDATVVATGDGLPERKRVHFVGDLLAVLRNMRTFDPKKPDTHAIAGNYVMLQSGAVFVLLAHLQCGSVCVAKGQQVAAGDRLGRVGHSGNSTAPHLHFQLMDSADPAVAKGIPCAFRQYEVLRGSQWETVKNGMPSDKDRFRMCTDDDENAG